MLVWQGRVLLYTSTEEYSLSQRSISTTSGTLKWNLSTTTSTYLPSVLAVFPSRKFLHTTSWFALLVTCLSPMSNPKMGLADGCPISPHLFQARIMASEVPSAPQWGALLCEQCGKVAPGQLSGHSLPCINLFFSLANPLALPEPVSPFPSCSTLSSSSERVVKQSPTRRKA